MTKFFEYANLITTILAIGISFVSHYKVIRGMSIKQVSDRIHSAFTPSNWTFYIWILIYIFQLASNFYSIFHPNRLTHRMSVFPMLLNIFNIIWVFTFLFNIFFFSTLTLITMLGFLIQIYIALNIRFNLHLSWELVVFYYIPYSMYFGWITIASITSTFYTVVNWGEGDIPYDDEKDGFIDKKSGNEVIAAMTALYVLLIPLTFLIFYRNDYVYTAVILFCLIGLITNQNNDTLHKSIILEICLIVIGVTFSILHLFNFF